MGYDWFRCTSRCVCDNRTNHSRYFLMKDNYWKNAELINGRLAMLGLVIGTINYGLFGWIAPGLF
ncbi:MAG: high light inducible protein [Pseudomonadota bacterium]|nr:high light inducible protein [Pseudomonadota bacterium]